MATTTVTSPPHLLTESEMTRIPPGETSECYAASTRTGGAPRLKQPIPAQMHPYEYSTRVGARESAQIRRSALTQREATPNTTADPDSIALHPKPWMTMGTNAMAATHWVQRRQGVRTGIGCRTTHLAYEFKLGALDRGPHAVQVVPKERAERGSKQETSRDWKGGQQHTARRGGCKQTVNLCTSQTRTDPKAAGASPTGNLSP